ncbi:uncharacterized protein [Eurosta solidaginis]|uniref:uncharacterized protein n=1 Tax=Eurosta solidaginis TaxID=178769 RepID=UPI0035310BCE
MSRQTCNYEGCYNQRLPFSAASFFKLPSDEPRRTQWILNSGNKTLKSLTNTQTRYFCEKHFQQKDIKASGYKKQLHRHAVLIPHPNVPSTSHNPMTSSTNINIISTKHQDYTHFEKAYTDKAEELTQDRYMNDVEEDLQYSYLKVLVETRKGDAEENFQNECTADDEKLHSQQNEMSESDIRIKADAQLELSSSDNCFVYNSAEADGQDVLNYIMENTNEHELTVSISELGAELLLNNPKMSAAANDTNEQISIDLNYESSDTQMTTNAAVVTKSYIITKNNSARCAEELVPVPMLNGHSDRHYQNSCAVEDYNPGSTSPQQQVLPNTSNNDSTKSTNGNINNIATAIKMLSNAESYDVPSDDFNKPIRADNSYESDKHYALSLLYLFQRLNAKKRTKAKIDILTYLLALESDDDVVLEAQK